MSAGDGLVERLLPPVGQLGDDGEPKPTRMDRREQLVAVGLGFANLAIAAAMAALMDNQQAPALLAGVAASLMTVVGARLGNRLVGMFGLFLSVVTRNSASTAVFFAFGAPYYGAALWMFLRYNRMVKAQAVLRRQQRAEKGGGSPAPRARPGRRSDTTGPAVKAAARPSASKRYTPPKPAKKRPPPPPKPPRDRSIVD